MVNGNDTVPFKNITYIMNTKKNEDGDEYEAMPPDFVYSNAIVCVLFFA